MICSGRLRSFQGLTFRQVRKNPTFLIKCAVALSSCGGNSFQQRVVVFFFLAFGPLLARTVILVLMTHTATD